jgi:hypothetical protein
MKSFTEFRESNKPDVPKYDEKTWSKWNTLVNMTPKELKSFYDSDEGKEAGMKQSDANKAGIDSGRESARMLLKMIPIGTTFDKALKNWTPTMWEWCKKQNSFISRMKGMRSRMVGNPFERDGKKTRWLLSLLIWGHDPRKSK